MLARLGRWRVGAAWWAAALLIGPALVAAVLFGLALYSADFVPGLLTTEDKLGLLIFGLGWGLLGGGLLEELGWTGFVVPMLTQRYGTLATGLIVGLLWGAWHLLIAFWASRGLAGEASLAGFIAGFVAFYFVALPAYRVLMGSTTIRLACYSRCSCTRSIRRARSSCSRYQAAGTSPGTPCSAQRCGPSSPWSRP